MTGIVSEAAGRLMNQSDRAWSKVDLTDTTRDTDAIAEALNAVRLAVCAVAESMAPVETVELSATLVDAQAAEPADDGAGLIARERAEQVTREGYTREHDLSHAGSELAWGAFCYLERAAQTRLTQDDPAVPQVWPWARGDWKPGPTQIRNLVKAGALICAEIDRLVAVGGNP